MRKFIVLGLVVCVTTSAWSNDLEQALISLFGAAGEYIGAGYQLSYVDQTGCNKYPFKKDIIEAFSASINDVRKMIRGSMLNDLLKAIDPLKSRLKQEVDVLIGAEPTAFQCGKAKGMLVIAFEQSKSNWLQAVRKFNQAKQDQAE